MMIMNDLKTTTKNRWLVVMLLSICCWSIPQSAWADRYEQQSSNYQAFLSGTDQITIKVPIFDKDGYDSWVRNGRLFYTVEGSSTEYLLLFWGVNDGEDDSGIDPSEYSDNRKDWSDYGDN